MGWFQYSLRNRIQPANGNLLTWLADSPANTNNVTTVTTGLSFTVGFLAPTRSLFNYSSSESRQLTAWKVDNNGGGSVGDWQYLCQDPYQGDNIDNWRNGGFGGGYTGTSIARGDELRVPNDLSRSELQCDTQIAFQTASSTLLTDVQNFNCQVDVNYANAYQDRSLYSSLQPANFPFTMGLDFSTVLPIAIESITFSPNPAMLGSATTLDVTGTVTLASPARLDTPIFLASNSQNATVLPKVTVKKGQQSANFQVLVNGNGLSPGQNTVATLTASYGNGFQTTLTVQR